MNKTRSVVLYSIIRVVLFAAVFALLMAMQINWYISAALAALISLCISYIFLSRARDNVSRAIYEVRHREKEPVREDDEVEDAALDRLEEERPERERPETELHETEPLERERRAQAQPEHQAGEAG